MNWAELDAEGARIREVVRQQRRFAEGLSKVFTRPRAEAEASADEPAPAPALCGATLADGTAVDVDLSGLDS